MVLATLPRSGTDIYSDEVLLDPYPTYRTLRDMGSAVYLEPVDAVFVGRFDDVRAALGDWQRFSSGKGIGLNPIINEAWQEALICQDPPVHTERRRLMTQVLSPAALKPVAETIELRAAQLVDRIIELGTFDGVTDFAHDLPIGVVMNLIGWPQDVRPRLLEIAAGSWNAAGPANARMQSGLGQLGEMLELVSDIFDQNRVEPGGFAASLIDAARTGNISREAAIGMLMGYIVAAFETTISAMAAGLWLFAKSPNEWTKLRAHPELLALAAGEIVRYETPLQNFARWTEADCTMADGSVIPSGTRVIVSYASANHDERRFDRPEEFIIDRSERQNVGFGHGVHLCAGQSLARMELLAVYGAMAKKIARIELAAEPTRSINNIARGFTKLPIRVTAA